MRRPAVLLSVCFCAGLIGALAGFWVVWTWEMLDLPSLPTVAARPLLAPHGFYPRLVWGGLWGLLYFVTVGSVRTRRRWVQKGVLVSLLPSLAYLVFIFPDQLSADPGGSLAGPLLTLVVNLIWGLFAAVMTRLIWGRS